MTEPWDEPTIATPIRESGMAGDDPGQDSMLDGRYRLVETIGSGGMATVFLAHDERLGRDVAVKIIRSASGMPAPPLREERVASTLLNANIVSIFDAGEIPAGEQDAGSTYIVMEYVRGTTAHAVAPVPWRRAVDIVRQAALGLAAAHERGIVHCDVKPGNLLIDTSGRVLVADFGVAAEAQSEVGSFVHGSPAYLAPERLTGAPADPTIDVYGLGGVLVFLLTGSKPERGNPLVLPADCPQALQTLIERACAENPRDRFPDAGELSAALSGLLDSAGDKDSQERDLTDTAVVAPTGQRESRLAEGMSLSAQRMQYRPATPSGARRIRPAREPEFPVTTLARPRGTETARKHSPTLVAAIVLAVIVVIVGAFVVQDIVTIGDSPAASAAPVEMPDVRGQTLGGAVERLTFQGITVDRVDVVYGPGPINEIVVQQPDPGTNVADTDDIVLVVRTGR